MTEKTIEFQARVYVYDLQNCAREFGFKADENWEVTLASAHGKTLLEKQYFPAVSLKTMPESLVELLGLIRLELRQKINNETAPDATTIRQQELQYVVAYNAGRQRS
ncbi:hypothetical protein FO440_23065 [Mucilaginibacter corticis]|uniref:Uncharacterized protein n=1 Tax=Mucilaginibacter corticis TaxID=2597670 RepID=A0A556M8Y5_9SPHI|nr:hypothetical protein [Mucilaginibacter corticis]TSJ36384.1 hypothetical protein FO440_23065 [Mucilaginibacter corticis]